MHPFCHPENMLRLPCAPYPSRWDATDLLVTFESTADLRDAGFKGFHTVRDLRISRLAAVPEAAGVYLIVRPDRSPPEFLDISPAGYFKCSA